MSGKKWVMSGKMWVTRLCNPHLLTNPSDVVWYNDIIYSTCTDLFNWSVSCVHVIWRAKRAPHWGIQSRFRVI